MFVVAPPPPPAAACPRSLVFLWHSMGCRQMHQASPPGNNSNRPLVVTQSGWGGMGVFFVRPVPYTSPYTGVHCRCHLQLLNTIAVCMQGLHQKPPRHSMRFQDRGACTVQERGPR